MSVARAVVALVIWIAILAWLTSVTPTPKHENLPRWPLMLQSQIG
jgi:hypothetical protein